MYQIIIEVNSEKQAKKIYGGIKKILKKKGLDYKVHIERVE